MYLVTCLHLENKSERLFRHSVFFAFIMSSFSSRHKLHRLDPGLYALTFFIMDHFICQYQAALMRRRTPKHACLQIVLYICIYLKYSLIIHKPCGKSCQPYYVTWSDFISDKACGII